MAKVVQDNPNDDEAKMFYALAINQTAPPTDKTYAKQLQAAGILEPLFKKMPEHPGLAHYIIHAYDTPALAERALVAARRYASLAPAVPHALHMPSHTFTRVGSWKESIETNRESAEAARKDKGAGEELHALDYQAYAYLQLGAGQGGQGRSRSRAGHRRRRGRHGGRRGWRRRLCHRRDSGALRARARRLGRSRRSSRLVPPTRRSPKRSRTSRARSAQPGAAIRRPRPQTSRSLRTSATS